MEITKNQKDLMMYLEWCLYEHSGRIQKEKMSPEDWMDLAVLANNGLLEFGQLNTSNDGVRALSSLYNTEFVYWFRPLTKEFYELVYKFRREKIKDNIERHDLERETRGIF